MPRHRIAIAHFASSAAALRTRIAVLAIGGTATASLSGRDEPNVDPPCRLEVALPPVLERRLLDILLGSEATLVDIHDA